MASAEESSQAGDTKHYCNICWKHAAVDDFRCADCARNWQKDQLASGEDRPAMISSGSAGLDPYDVCRVCNSAGYYEGHIDCSRCFSATLNESAVSSELLRRWVDFRQLLDRSVEKFGPEFLDEFQKVVAAQTPN